MTCRYFVCVQYRGCSRSGDCRSLVFVLGVKALRVSNNMDDVRQRYVLIIIVSMCRFVIPFLACGDRRPSQLFWNSAKASTSSSLFFQPRWVPSAMHAECRKGRFEGPQILHSAVAACDIRAQANAAAPEPEKLLCTFALTLTSYNRLCVLQQSYIDTRHIPSTRYLHQVCDSVASLNLFKSLICRRIDKKKKLG